MRKRRFKDLLFGLAGMALGLYLATIGGNEWTETGSYRVSGRGILRDTVRSGHDLNRNRQIAGWALAGFGLVLFFRWYRHREDLDPVPILQKTPVYPPDFERRGVSGRAVVDMVIDDAGNVRDVKVVRATNPEFGVAALAAARQWQFRPAVKLGRPVDVHVQIPIDFHPRRTTTP